MNINYKPSQIELFPSNSNTIEDLNKPRFFFANLTLPLESLVILSILVIMVSVFAFAIGVEQGKKMVAQSLDEKVSQAWNVDARRSRVVVAPVVAAVAVKTAPLPAVKASPMPAGNRGNVIAKTPIKTVAKLPATVTVNKPRVLVSPVSHRVTAQLATYRNESFARDEAVLLRTKGVQTFLVKSGGFWLVCAGEFKNKEDAQGFINKLPGKYRKAPVRRF